MRLSEYLRDVNYGPIMAEDAALKEKLSKILAEFENIEKNASEQAKNFLAVANKIEGIKSEDIETVKDMFKSHEDAASDAISSAQNLIIDEL